MLSPLSRLTTPLLVIALSAPALAAQSACDTSLPASAQAPYLCAQPGDLIDARLDAFRPTQSVLGKDEIFYKLGRYRSNKDQLNGNFNKRFDDWCEANGQVATAWANADARLDNPASFGCSVALGSETADSIAVMKSAVIGPGGQLYLTDGHHTFTSFMEANDGGPALHVRVRVVDNLSALSQADFWQAMQDNRRVWLRDENDQPITVEQLPARLGLASFHNDKYRSLVYFTRDIGYSVPTQATEFLEFYWGSWLRRNGVDVSKTNLADSAAYLKLVKQTSQTMAALPLTTVLDGSVTAASAGRIAQWNGGKKETGGEFDKLSKAFSEAKPGKIAYSLNFQSDIVAAPVCTSTLSGAHDGTLNVNSGVLCLDRVTQQGDVIVAPGAALVANGSSLNGVLSSNGATAIYLCGNQISGSLALNATNGAQVLGGNGCTFNSVAGSAAITWGNGTSVLSGNQFGGALMCFGNQPELLNPGRSNQAGGAKVYQCESL
ncbi:Putative ParB-like nuclease [Andreprevotia lacus DSM 23236]|jgi:hypothetical protein|uniref:Putative ParB-like nuclease n=1 Tax=Andreprevotia lacus DSM 23236 TaxID=1121001 RepID=A0A1W1XM84_9NEIS|nr:ParB/Srx family N-terminal domain-containing protein [Andreprevotia lacus]SMC24964.1 Putative ParB-like nuclease [Andreprevotia lacus DSM 23236]